MCDIKSNAKRVLIYGAGVIGCFLAHALCEAGQEVTVLARGTWKNTLEKEGLVINHSLQKKKTTDHPLIIEEVNEDTEYDAVFAVMQHQQMRGILPKLARINSPIITLVGNNMSAPEMEKEILSLSEKPKTILFGFQGTGGRRENGTVICVRFGEGSMSLGGLHGEVSDAVKETVQSLFSGTKYRLTWVPDMDAWYRCHLTLILPAAYLCYATDCNLRKAGKYYFDPKTGRKVIGMWISYRDAYEDKDAERQADIHIEQLNARILLIAGTGDEAWDGCIA